MAVLAIALLVVGLLKKQQRKYWIVCFVAVQFQAVMSLVFHAETGFLAPAIRKLVGEGPAEGIYIVVLVAVTWIGAHRARWDGFVSGGRGSRTRI
jgi:hypothetical protein